MENASIQFLKESMGVELEIRDTQKVEIDPDTVQSGDFLGAMRTDGLGTIIQYGTGAHISHNVMALRFDDGLYIVESTDPGGLQRTPWDEWMAMYDANGDSVTYHRLSDEARAKFDEKKAQDFFFETAGLPYGYHTFLYGWADSANDNWPPLFPRDFMPIMWKIVEDVKPDLAYNMFT